MSPTRVVMTGESIEVLRRRVREVHGPGARIVAAQRVTVGGVGGLFARKHVEATVEVPDPTNDTPSARVTISPPASRAGIAALLADADAADGFSPAAGAGAGAGPDAASAGGRRPADGVASDPFDDVLSGAAARAARATSPRRAARAAAASADVRPLPSPSSSGQAPLGAAPEPATRSDAFAEIMDDFTFNGIAPTAASTSPEQSVRPEEARPGPLTNAAEFLAAAAASSSPALVARRAGDVPAPPAVLSGAGDLIVVVGRPGDAFRVAAQMASTFGLRSVDASDRRGAILARAEGVHGGTAVVTALGWDPSAAESLRSMAADQVWVAVDVGRKHDDTARWVEEVRAVQTVAAAAVVGEADTATPGTVHLLGVAVGWREQS
ncbi:hypothetical protein [Frigoribacterium faeni]|uniref:Uncharacterized protein n=2 Tax=Frigoribacterium faeni TaxID=145483 RepID=A0A7W3JKX8_9MICO|nr:hypothetical protein [Frigoribacterium faeni]MBA8814733.1 hypothetical protein [Frigoribacterium faeni]